MVFCVLLLSLTIVVRSGTLLFIGWSGINDRSIPVFSSIAVCKSEILGHSGVAFSFKNSVRFIGLALNLIRTGLSSLSSFSSWDFVISAHFLNSSREGGKLR